MFLLDAVGDVTNAGYGTFTKIVNTVFPILIGVILVFAMFYGITLAVKYAKAEEDEDKKKAKSALINVIVGCLIAIVFVAIIQVLLSNDHIASILVM